jgi:hypothetical protein
MDVGLFARVAIRFKWLVIPGILLAIALAGLSVVRVSLDKPHVVYRKPQQWISYASVLVTQQGFPWGQIATGTRSSADPSRFVGLSVVWSQLALSDPVRQILLRSGPIDGTLDAAPVLDPNTKESLPMISIAAVANSPEVASSLAQRETTALLNFLAIEQASSSIPDENRISMTVTSKASPATLFKGRSKTLPIVIFLTVLIAVLALAFLLENLRPRVAVLREAEARPQGADVAA